ncbi:MAG: hypothetical protein R3248_05800 [Candidatus Promineifilaceae bacterium]|nr:hypothetical protein [Candidatus Promineifilaceae bacterium]
MTEREVITTMLLKRIVLIIISLVLGALITTGIVIFVLSTTVGEYGTFYFTMTAFFIACAIGIWLDKFMDTKLLPE